MEDLKEWRRQSLNNFVGYGNPTRAHLVFVGSEEYGDFWNFRQPLEKKLAFERQDRILQLYESADDHFLHKEKWHVQHDMTDSEFEAYQHSQKVGYTEKFQVKLARQLRKLLSPNQPEASATIDETAYREKEFCVSFEIASNLSPIAKKSESKEHSQWTLEYLGFASRRELNEYLRADARFGVLHKAFSPMIERDVYFVNLGMNESQRNILKTEVYQLQELKGSDTPRPMWCSANGRISFVPHPSRKSDYDLEQVMAWLTNIWSISQSRG
jgi:hypothetical protein